MVILSFILCVNVAAGSELICASVFSYICKETVLKPDIDFHRCPLVSLVNRLLSVFICQEHVFFFFCSFNCNFNLFPGLCVYVQT